MTSVSLTDHQTKLLKAVMEVMKAEIDFDKVAKIAELSTAKYARDQWNIVRKKLIAPVATTGSATDGKKVTKVNKKAVTSKRKTTEGDDEEESPLIKKVARKAESEIPVADPEVKVEETIAEPNQAADAMDAML